MSTLNQDLHTDLLRALHRAFPESSAEIPEGFAAKIDQAKDPRFGDYQSNCAMVLAKVLRKKPRDIAQGIVEHFESKIAAMPEIAGPGFLNFRVTDGALVAKLDGIAKSDRLGVPQVEQPQTIVIDFSAPNVAKPMHIGHIRSTVIGDCLARVARFVGHRVITDNHIGDWGTQFGMIIYGWKHELDQAALAADSLAELLRIYKKVNAAGEADPAVREACKAELVKLQAGDSENRKIWDQCVAVSLSGLREIYDRLHIEFDHWLGESHYNDRLAPLVAEYLAQGIAREDDGAVGIFSDGSVPEKADPFLVQRDGEWIAQPAIIRKADGGFLYATTDLATCEHRLNTWKADEIWYVVDARQASHFRQVFAAATRAGLAAKFTHIKFGTILDKKGRPLKTRDGDLISLNSVLDAAVHGRPESNDGEEVVGAIQLIEEKSSQLSPEEKLTIAQAVGIGAIKYAELSQYRMTDYQFDWQQMLSFRGNTAPYLQNSYVRIRSIFRKLEAGSESYEDQAAFAPTEDAERTLAMRLCQFGEAVPGVLVDHRPNVLTTYLFDVARAFHSFYEECPVLKSEGATRASRLRLCALTAEVLRRGLSLLGIAVPDRM